MRRFIFTVAVFVTAFAVSAGEIQPEALDALPDHDVVILGEVHDNSAHHLNQARAVKALNPAALVFEMLTPEQALSVTAVNRLDEGLLGAALGWAETGWPDFGIYFPIFEASPKAVIYGAALPRADVRRAVREGAMAVFGKSGNLFGLADNLTEPEQIARETLQMEAHCNALPENLLGGMVEAQRLRDASLAAAVLNAMDKTGGPVVVITGNGHARADWGVPVMLARAKPGMTVLSLAQFELEPWENAPFDLYVLTSEAEREDPCAAFRKD